MLEAGLQSTNGWSLAELASEHTMVWWTLWHVPFLLCCWSLQQQSSKLSHCKVLESFFLQCWWLCHRIHVMCIVYSMPPWLELCYYTIRMCAFRSTQSPQYVLLRRSKLVPLYQRSVCVPGGLNHYSHSVDPNLLFKSNELMNSDGVINIQSIQSLISGASDSKLL